MELQTTVQNNSTVEPDRQVDNDIGLENEEESKKGHRRSKNDTEGRTYKCKLCGKSYLSYPALYTHSKQKHNTCNTSGRGRGRPKKETNEVSFSPLYFTFQILLLFY